MFSQYLTVDCPEYVELVGQFGSQEIIQRDVSIF